MMNKKIYSILGILIVLSIFVFSQDDLVYGELKETKPDEAADLLLKEKTLNIEKAEELLSQKETKEVKALSQEKKKELGERYFSERLGLGKEQSFNINKEAKFELTEVEGKKILKTNSIEVEINKLKSLSSSPDIKGFEITKEGLLEIKQKEAESFKISDLGSIGVGEDGKTVFFHAKEEGKVKVDFGDGVPIEGKIVSFTRIAAGTRVAVTSTADLTGEFKIKSGDEMFTIQPASLRKPKPPKVLVDSQVIIEKDSQERVSKIYTLQAPDGFKGITSEGLKFSSQAGSLAFDYKDRKLTKISGKNYNIKTEKGDLNAQFESGELNVNPKGYEIKGIGDISYNGGDLLPSKDNLKSKLTGTNSRLAINQIGGDIEFRLDGRGTLECLGLKSDSLIDGYIDGTFYGKGSSKGDLVVNTKNAETSIKPIVESKVIDYVNKRGIGEYIYVIADNFEDYKELKGENTLMVDKNNPELFDAKSGENGIFFSRDVEKEEGTIKEEKYACIDGKIIQEKDKIKLVADKPLAQTLVEHGEVILHLGENDLTLQTIRRPYEYAGRGEGIFLGTITTGEKKYAPLEYIFTNKKGTWKIIPTIEKITISPPEGRSFFISRFEEEEYIEHIKALWYLRYYAEPEIQEYLK